MSATLVLPLRVPPKDSAMPPTTSPRTPLLRAFQWLFFPLSLVTGITVMGVAMAHGAPVALLATAIPLFFLVLIGVVERLLPYERDWNRARGDVGADLSSLVIVALGVESIFKAVGPVAVIWILTMLHLPKDFSVFPRTAPFWVQCAIVIVFIDFVKYWFHRMGHETRFWWPLHSVHHAVKRVHMLNGFRIHPIYHTLTYILGYFPCILLGAPAETLFVHTVILGIVGGFQHCNIDLRYGVLNYVFSTNEIHRWHHSTKVSEGNKNYGAIFSFFDVLFGTYHNVPGRAPAVIGMVHEEGYPLHSYLGQLAIPFTYGRRVKNAHIDDLEPLDRGGRAETPAR